MLDKSGFDLWADNYDKSVSLSDDSNEYPFAGYKEILNSIFNIVMQKPNSRILDVGIGTGVISKRLYDYIIKLWVLTFPIKCLIYVEAKCQRLNLYSITSLIVFLIK